MEGRTLVDEEMETCRGQSSSRSRKWAWGPSWGPQGKPPACWELSFVVLRLKGHSGGPPAPSPSSVHGDHAVLPGSDLMGCCREARRLMDLYEWYLSSVCLSLLLLIMMATVNTRPAEWSHPAGDLPPVPRKPSCLGSDVRPLWEPSLFLWFHV